jgi:carbamoyl-phosphate synthase large subunit
MKVLVTGAGALLGQGIIKSLRMAHTPYYIVAVDPDPRAAGLYWADRAYLVSYASEPRYLDEVCQIIDYEQPDAVLVGTDVELMIFATNKQKIDSTYQTRVIVSPPDTIQIADDKWLTYQFLSSYGFPHPRSALRDNMDALLSECGFPLVVKPRSGARSVGVHVVKNEKELNHALDQVDNPIVQEMVSSPEEEYTSGVVITEGRVRSVITMRRDLRDGNTYRAYVEPDAPFNSILSSVAEELGGMGSINFQFRSDKGVPKIFEINARFSGTTPLRAYAGFNEVDLVVRHYVYGDPIPTPSLRPAVILRYWDEIVVDPEELNGLSHRRQLPEPRFEHPGSTSESVSLRRISDVLEAAQPGTGWGSEYARVFGGSLES